MAKPKLFSIGPIEGQGRTKTEAREDACARAAKALERLDERVPVFVPAVPSSRKEVAGIVVFPTINGYGYALCLADGGQAGWTGGIQFYTDAVLRAVRHLADLPLDGSTETLAEVLQWHKDLANAAYLLRIVVELDRSFDQEIRAKHAYTACYRAYRDQGFSDAEAHGAACTAKNNGQF